MTSKPRNFDPNLYYHIYNCGVEKRSLFLNKRDYQRFLDTIAYYLHNQTLSYADFQRLPPKARVFHLQTNPKGSESSETQRVKLLAYCLMPNHFHFLLKPAKEVGITKFISDISNSYTKYFNIKNKRVGGLLQGTFKAKEIAGDASLLQVSRYIHLNPISSSQTNLKGSSIKKPEEYSYSSYTEWIALDLQKPLLMDQEELSSWIKLAGGTKRYRDFVESKINQNPALGIEDLTLE